MAEFLSVTPNFLLYGKDEEVNVNALSKYNIELERVGNFVVEVV